MASSYASSRSKLLIRRLSDEELSCLSQIDQQSNYAGLHADLPVGWFAEEPGKGQSRFLPWQAAAWSRQGSGRDHSARSSRALALPGRRFAQRGACSCPADTLQGKLETLCTKWHEIEWSGRGALLKCEKGASHEAGLSTSRCKV